MHWQLTSCNCFATRIRNHRFCRMILNVRGGTWSDMVCCRCNRTGTCGRCACARASRICDSCLLGRLGTCTNTLLANTVTVLSSATTVTADVNFTITNEEDDTGASSSSPETQTIPVPSHSPPDSVIFLEELATAGLADMSCSGIPSQPDELLAALEELPLNCENPDLSHHTPELPHFSPELPQYTPLFASNAFWHGICSERLTQIINDVYCQIVHWTPNLFKLPSGALGKRFIAELAQLFRDFAIGSALEHLSIKVAMIMPTLLLQKLNATSKTKDHVSCLQRRFVLWEKVDLNELLTEGRSIQRHLPTMSCSGMSTPQNKARLANKFSTWMLNSKVRSALRLLSQSNNSSFLSLHHMLENGKLVKTVLQEKHPDAASIDLKALINSPLDFQQDFYPSLFDNITPEIIRACALHTEGTACPSGVDAVSWRRFCTAFGEKSNELCAAVAALAATTYVDPVSLVAYTACKLILLNKNGLVKC